MSGQVDQQLWYLKTQGQIRGPYSTGVIDSMRSRGRLTADMQVSNDRRVWYPLSHLGGAFAVEASATPPPLEGESAGSYFYTRDGSQQGPVSLEALRAMVDAGTLNRTDLAWAPGMPQWTGVAALLNLGTPRSGPLARFSWLRDNPAAAISIALAALAILLVPTGYAFHLWTKDNDDARKVVEKAEAERQAAENARKDLIAKVERKKDEAKQRNERLLQRRQQKVSELEATRRQATTPSVQNLVDEALQRSIRDLQADLKQLDDQLAETEAELKDWDAQIGGLRTANFERPPVATPAVGTADDELRPANPSSGTLKRID